MPKVAPFERPSPRPRRPRPRAAKFPGRRGTGQANPRRGPGGSLVGREEQGNGARPGGGGARFPVQQGITGNSAGAPLQPRHGPLDQEVDDFFQGFPGLGAGFDRLVVGGALAVGAGAAGDDLAGVLDLG